MESTTTTKQWNKAVFVHAETNLPLEMCVISKDIARRKKSPDYPSFGEIVLPNLFQPVTKEITEGCYNYLN